MVHAQQYQKQQGNSTAILIRSYKLGAFDPQKKTIPILSTDTRSPPSTEATLPSTDIFHPTSIDTSYRTSIDTEPRDMVATLVFVPDENEDLHDEEGHLRNAAGQKIDAQGTVIPEHDTDAT
ncbi:hypothetical protein F2Q69_00022997 [Brassica cretica]|uniref:Uncharacterized protein n=1 Tax=Brassica cretica TaxID=69181 RepID=A0A8S9QJK5_BRACR|nr:hypothetical protein F2Q69_00022997 [Brassica cretica]